MSCQSWANAMSKLCQCCAKLLPKLCQSSVNVVPMLCQKNAKVVPRLFQRCAKELPMLYQSYKAWRLNLTHKHTDRPTDRVGSRDTYASKMTRYCQDSTKDLSSYCDVIATLLSSLAILWKKEFHVRSICGHKMLSVLSI